MFRGKLDIKKYLLNRRKKTENNESEITRNF